MMGQLRVYEKFVAKQMVMEKPSLPSLTYKYFIHPRAAVAYRSLRVMFSRSSARERKLVEV
jgi:hypothetical protein